MRITYPPLCLFAVAVAALAQTPTQLRDAFDVATIKPTPASATPVQPRMSGGPGTSDPGRIDYHAVTLASLVQRAFGLPYYRLSAPAWMNTTRFDIEAKFAADTNEDRLRRMFQDLLATRFRFVSHLESKRLPVYELSIGKDGSKLTPWRAGEAPQDAPGKITPDADGYPVLPAGVNFAVINGGHARLRATKEKVTNLAEFLSGVADRPVLDATGLSGEYNFQLSWVMHIPGSPAASNDAAIGPDVFAALEQQLGLKLEPKTSTLDVLVVDGAEKTPVEN